MSQTPAFVGASRGHPFPGHPIAMTDTSLPTNPTAPTPNGPLVPQGARGLIEQAVQALAASQTALNSIATEAGAIADPTLKATIQGLANDASQAIDDTPIYNDYPL